MPTYEYECRNCGGKFEWQQGIAEAPVAACPQCRGPLQRLVSGGAGFIMKGKQGGRQGRGRSACSLEESGQTCCGRQERCQQPSCGDDR